VQERRKVRVLVHRVVFLPQSPEHLLVKVTNLSKSREIEITHIWFDTQPPIHMLDADRPLPTRLRVDETVETWGSGERAASGIPTERMARVQLPNGTVVNSR
jgi:hypothetical protein